MRTSGSRKKAAVDLDACKKYRQGYSARKARDKVGSWRRKARGVCTVAEDEKCLIIRLVRSSCFRQTCNCERGRGFELKTSLKMM